MSLDLSIRKMGKVKINKKGQQYWTITELINLRNTWDFLDKLDKYNTIKNCYQTEFSGEDIYSAANEIPNETEKEEVINELKEARIKNSEDIYYEVHPWW